MDGEEEERDHRLQAAWLFLQIQREEPVADDTLDAALQHLEKLCLLIDELQAVGAVAGYRV